MEIAVVGSPEFTLGFQLAGISTLYNPEGEEETSKVFRDLLTTKVRELIQYFCHFVSTLTTSDVNNNLSIGVLC